MRGLCLRVVRGGVPEWSIGAVSKTVVRASVPWVRIPPPPPDRSQPDKPERSPTLGGRTHACIRSVGQANAGGRIPPPPPDRSQPDKPEKSPTLRGRTHACIRCVGQANAGVRIPPPPPANRGEQSFPAPFPPNPLASRTIRDGASGAPRSPRPISHQMPRFHDGVFRRPSKRCD